MHCQLVIAPCFFYYNTTSARLSKLGATPAAQVSGGQIPLPTKKTLLKFSHFRTSILSLAQGDECDLFFSLNCNDTLIMQPLTSGWEATRPHKECKVFQKCESAGCWDVHMFFRVAKMLKRMSHQDESTRVHCQRTLTLTTGQAVQRARRCAEKTRLIAVHMKLLSTGPDLQIWCGSLPPPEPREFPVRSAALAKLGCPRCSVSSRQSRELRPCSPPTRLGTCRHRSQTRRCVNTRHSSPHHSLQGSSESIRHVSLPTVQLDDQG